MCATDYLYPISPDEVDAAVSSLSVQADHYAEAAHILRAIKADGQLVGRVFNRASVATVSAAIGSGYAVRYGISDSLKRRPRCLYVQQLDEQGEPIMGSAARFEFEFATVDAPRLTAERLDQLITYHSDKVGEYLRAAADLPQKVAEYNVAAAYLRPLRSEVSGLMLKAQIR